ncbi:MAG: NUDIX hydrolase [Clostridia bacterium]|nr:NUDIX hydrolase [Clostridia bacterium]
MNDLMEKTLTSQEIYNGRVVHLFRDTVALPNGKEGVREVIRHPGAVCVIPVTEAGDVVMVRQFRYPFSTTLLEIPAGKMEQGEDPLDCAMRELSEETGAQASKWTELGVVYPSVAYLDEKIYIYLAHGLTFGKTHTDEDEFLHVEKYPLGTVLDMVMEGDIPDGKTQIAILKACRLLGL